MFHNINSFSGSVAIYTICYNNHIFFLLLFMYLNHFKVWKVWFDSHASSKHSSHSKYMHCNVLYKESLKWKRHKMPLAVQAIFRFSQNIFTFKHLYKIWINEFYSVRCSGDQLFQHEHSRYVNNFRKGTIHEHLSKVYMCLKGIMSYQNEVSY